VRIKGIKGRENLLEVKASKNRYRCHLFTAKILKKKGFYCTICITKKSGCAVIRNKVRRWFRVAFQEQYQIYPIDMHGFFFVFPVKIDFLGVRNEVKKFFMLLDKKDS
jgi:ribonuclease P protein component